MYVLYRLRDEFSGKWQLYIYIYYIYLRPLERWLESSFGFYQFWTVLTSFDHLCDSATANCNLGVPSCLSYSKNAAGTVPQTVWHKECSLAGAACHNLSTAMKNLTANLIVFENCSCLSLSRHLIWLWTWWFELSICKSDIFLSATAFSLKSETLSGCNLTGLRCLRKHHWKHCSSLFFMFTTAFFFASISSITLISFPPLPYLSQSLAWHTCSFLVLGCWCLELDGQG